MTTTPDTATAEPSPWRDNGPYVDADQARLQLERVMFGIPVPEDAEAYARVCALAAAEAVAITGVTTTRYEDAKLADMAAAGGPDGAQVLAGVIVRAFLAGTWHAARMAAAPAAGAGLDEGD